MPGKRRRERWGGDRRLRERKIKRKKRNRKKDVEKESET